MHPPHLAIHDHSHEHARRDLELTHDEDVARASLIVDGDVNVLRIIIRMTDDPRAGWGLGARAVTLHRRRLVTRRAIGIPDAAFARWGIVALGDVEPGVPRRSKYESRSLPRSVSRSYRNALARSFAFLDSPLS